MKKRIIYDEILKELSHHKTFQAQIKFVSNKRSRDKIEKYICEAIKFRIRAVNSTKCEEKASFYKKSASVFFRLSKKNDSKFLKALYYENEGFSFTVKASNDYIVVKRLEKYKLASNLFKKGFLSAKKYGLTESTFLCKGWFELTKAMYYENLFYLKQDSKVIKKIFAYSNAANIIFKKIKIKKLIELSDSLIYYAQALKCKEEYNKSSNPECKKKFLQMLRKAERSITCKEFINIKKFYIDYLIISRRRY